MATKPITTEAIALTEKKMDMTLDDIIKMSKTPSSKEKKAPRRPIKSQGFLNRIASQRPSRVQHFMDSRASIRQGVLAQRRSNFHGNQLGNQFPLTTNAARRAAVMPIRSMATNWNKPRFAPVTAQRKAADAGPSGKDVAMVYPKQRPQTLDALFANMKENRMRGISSSQQQTFRGDDNRQIPQRRISRQQHQQRQQVRGDRGRVFPGRRSGNYAK
ncbi:uncharacterized protein A4U43_C05F19770 [Asparagus officinalis]|uniref:Uncharacterized protein n=1 Tax=Asparagus officinalis TaxID=4686 RepID=A0A5P1EYA4_ASPOF|nr:uncharacterized protein LOC109839992 [Asparagus officinalis]ONK69140.1 uncharacterized protein A4U43_C05F19770 [Asparagus officinalis]